MARGMPRRKCLEYTVLLGLVQIVITFGVVWFLRSAKTAGGPDPADKRLLLSVDYSSNRNGGLSYESSSSSREVVGGGGGGGGRNRVPVLDTSNFMAARQTSTAAANSNELPSIRIEPPKVVSPPLPSEAPHKVASGHVFSTSDTVFDFSEYEANLDKYRLFKTKTFTVTGSKWDKLSQSRQVCLGAQTSIDRLYWLLETAKTWSGPISIALFVPDIEFHISKIYLSFIRRCYPAIREQVSFHFAFPVSHPVRTSPQLSEVMESSLSCEKPKEALELLLKARSADMLSWRDSFSYPQNLLRNLAKSGCQTNYTFIPDIDMIPIPKMDLDLEDFLTRENSKPKPCVKCAYVVPTYEISKDSDHMPINKTELITYVKAKQARQFHQAVYSLNQKSSDLKRWEKMPQTESMDRAYRVEKYVFKYEPLYVARAETPLFDERFIGFGMTRNTQAYEMYVAGYQFVVLNNAFTNHWGLQTIKSRPKWRAKQQENNNKKFDEFALELIAKYGRDPYGMASKLKGYNFKNIKVAYGGPPKKLVKKKEEEEGTENKGSPNQLTNEARASS